MAESVVTSAAQIIVRILQWAWKTMNANSIILGVLVISILLNIMFSSLGTSDWWKERRARKFMAHLGVGPDLAMSKAISVHDLEDSTTLDVGHFGDHSSQCRDTFNNIMSLSDPEAPQPLKTLSPSRPQTATVRRLQRSRHHLGAKRHDLLVAMRVVNSIEREMVQAEWETWLTEESIKCKQLEAIIRQNSTELLTGKGKGIDRPKEISAWYQEYCGSCSKEQDLIGI